MNKIDINIVWLKRDIRSQDHEPLLKAEKANLPYIIIYLFEPSIIAYPDTSLRHLQFVYQSILVFNKKMKVYNREAIFFYGEAKDVFEYLKYSFNIKKIFSYQESGVKITWERDKEIASFCNRYNVLWEESQRDGVLRGEKGRFHWEKQWHIQMHISVIRNVYTVSKLPVLKHSFLLPDNLKKKYSLYSKVYQPAGESNAWKYLKTFTQERGFNYQKHISKPTESRRGCSRLSPYLAWGNVSVRQVFQFIGTHPNGAKHSNAFSAMLTRLHWHCHFIQKFEIDCSYETHCINKGFEILTHERNEHFIKSWKIGKTGFPLIDACMRAVEQTGWINFRMRAMVVSFLTLNLDQDWREGTYHLARQFLDYEPGIHYLQFQMQAGTTGVNMIRLYNPVKNSKEHDPEGRFIKKWIPELNNVPLSYIHEPWKMSLMEQEFCGVILGEDYPLPIVDLKESSKKARDKIWKHKEHPVVLKERTKVLSTLNFVKN